MKEIEELVTMTIDYGSFMSLAEKLGERVALSRYYSPMDEEFRDVAKCVIGTGIQTIERCDEYMDPDIIKETDLFIFPDIGYGGLQRYLRSIGKAVWGSMGASDLEIYRTRFLKMLEEVGLPVPPSKVITGVQKLTDYLKTVKDKWIKVNRFRRNMETWHHKDYEHSADMLHWLAVDFGGVADQIVFVVQDSIPDAQEIGYDGYSVDGDFPSRSFQGYEKKNELYLGTWLDAEDMPEPVIAVNKALKPVLKKYEYRNFIATELRDRFFIDPTMRLAGQTMEHQLESCTNLPEILWFGANGELKDPEYTHKFSAEATLHYGPYTDHWMTLTVPEEAKPWVKMYHCCEVDGVRKFPPHSSDEVGVVIGLGDTIEEAIEDLRDHLELLKDEPVTAKTNEFVDLIKEIKEAQESGVHFTSKKLPKPADVIG
jgi:hypothetical protein